jgi:hypothetical protein
LEEKAPKSRLLRPPAPCPLSTDPITRPPPP